MQLCHSIRRNRKFYKKQCFSYGSEKKQDCNYHGNNLHNRLIINDQWLIIIISGVIDTCKGRSRDSRILYTDTLSQLTLNPAPSGSGGQNPRHRNVGGSCIGIN